MLNKMKPLQDETVDHWNEDLGQAKKTQPTSFG